MIDKQLKSYLSRKKTTDLQWENIYANFKSGKCDKLILINAIDNCNQAQKNLLEHEYRNYVKIIYEN